MLKDCENKLSGGALWKMGASLKNSIDLDFFMNLEEQDFDFETKKLYRYAPMISASVERSLSAYKNLLSYYRARLTEVHIIQQIFVYFNRNINNNSIDID